MDKNTFKVGDFKLRENNFVLDQIKQITFKGKTSGKVLLDDIKINENEKH